MKRYLVQGFLSLIALLLVACERPEQPNENSALNDEIQSAKTANKATADTEANYKTIEWTDLIPKSDLEALMNPPDYLSEIKDGSLEDQLPTLGESLNENTTQNDPYQQALVSQNIIPEFNGKKVKLPGFIVPLEYNRDKLVTQFFLVPYFGACIHVPPPPPNQMLHISYPEGLELESIYDPLWLSGKLEVETVANELGTSAYSMQMEKYEIYE